MMSVEYKALASYRGITLSVESIDAILVDAQQQAVGAAVGDTIRLCGMALELLKERDQLAESLNKLVEAARTISAGSEVIRAKRDEHDDVHTHDDWAMVDLDKAAIAALAVIQKTTA